MDVVSCFEMDVLGVDCAAFDCHVFFSNQGHCFYWRLCLFSDFSVCLLRSIKLNSSHCDSI